MHINAQKKILVVEDDEVMRKIEISNLTRLNYEVFEAMDGEQAIAMLEKEPDIILLDLMLPKIDGFAVLEHIRKSTDPARSNVPVIVMSNLWSDKDILRTQALKIDSYFVKSSTTMDELMTKIEEAVKAPRV